MLTFSAGGATLAEGETAAELFAAADAQLYRAKHAGRNRVEWRQR
ncbi:diguanylate cyclase domain-containing protein [Pseudoduganella buxea]